MSGVNQTSPHIDPPAGPAALVRVGWMAGGSVLLIVVAMGIAREPRWSLGVLDLLFWSVVALAIYLRHLDVTRFAGETAKGLRATKRDVRRYGLGLTVLAALLWGLVHSIQV